MKYFIIPPMNHFFDFATAADGLFLLANELHRASDDFLESISYLPVEKMLDNGVYEREQLHFDLVLELADRVNADYVILPDDPWSPEESMHRQYEAYEEHKREHFQFIAVPHGRTRAQYWQQCLVLGNLTGYLGLSVITVWKKRGGMHHLRPLFAHAITRAMPDVRLHLLGLDEPAELFCLRGTNVASFDTTLPLTHAYHDSIISLLHYKRLKRMPMYWHKALTPERRALALFNIKRLREWAHGSDTY